MTGRTDFNGHTTTYTYDSMNRLTQKTADAFFSQGACAGGVCGAAQISYTYTPTGKRATMTDPVGQWKYGYDLRDRLTDKNNLTVSGLSVHWDYDRAGNLLDMQSAHASQTTYSYDALNRLSGVNNLFEQLPVTYSYDAVGNLNGMTEGPLSTNYTYDNLNRLTSMQTTQGSMCSTAAPGCVLANYSYTLGPAGNRLSVMELSGRTISYTYDDLYRLTSETIANATAQNGTISYQYDAVGNRLKLTSTVLAIPSGLLNYDANDRLSTDQYDANGNTVNNSGVGNVYDFEDHLVQHGGVIIVYDGDGNRVQETVAGNTTRYLVAEVNPTGYAQVIEEQTGNGQMTKFYLWGQQLVLATEFTSGFPTQLYGYDGHGSVRYLTDLNGKITDLYDYDAFGNLLSTTGSTPNNYLFAGEQFDPALGIYYNRARYYDERSGRFWTADTFEGDPESPASLHKYLYTGANPVTQIDPTGQETIAEEEVVVTEQQVLAALQSIIRAERALKLARIAKAVATGIVLLTVTLIAGDNTPKPAASSAPDAGPQTDQKRPPKTPKMLYRFGKDWEYAEALEPLSEQAQDAGFPHGVSAFSKLPPKYANNTGWAFWEEVTAYFFVQKTGASPFHYTVLLPHPVTEFIADRFNTIFHRTKPPE